MLEVPAGAVRLPSGRRRRVGAFRLDQRPVTNAEYARYVKETGAPRPAWLHRPGFGEPEQPVVGVSLAEAQAFAKWAGKRLPTEREWLRAARGADDRTYPWGEPQADASRAHFGRQSTGAPAPVENLSDRRAGAAPFGHLEIVGNVWEWCQGAVLRGGFWGSDDVRIDVRLVEKPDRRSGGIGFRCAL